MDIERARTYRAAWGALVRHLEAPQRFDMDSVEPYTAEVHAVLSEIAPEVATRVARLHDLYSVARQHDGFQLIRTQAAPFLGVGCLVEVRINGQPECWIVDPDALGGEQLLALLKAGRKEA